MIKTVLLDLDDTIFDFHYAEAEALRQLFRQYGRIATDEVTKLYSEINDAYWKRLERGELTRAEVQTGRFAELFARVGVDRDPEVANVRYKEIIADIHCYVAGAEQLLCDLRREGYSVYVVSNGSRSVQTRRLANAGLTNAFDGVFLSEDLGVEKPSKAFFEVCFSKVPSMKPEETIILGDSLTSDILGGKNAGIKTCWFNRFGKARRTDICPDYEISSLDQFIPLIKEQ